MFSPSQKLHHILAKAVEDDYLHNVELGCNPSDVINIFGPDEECVAKLRVKSGEDVYLSGERLLLKQNNAFRSIPYRGIVRYHWMTDSLELHGHPEFKRNHYDRLIFELASGEKITLEGLDQAVFSIMKFLRWLKWREAKTGVTVV